MNFSNQEGQAPMTFTEYLDSFELGTFEFGEKRIDKIIDAIINSSELTSKNLKNVISQKRIETSFNEKKMETQLINFLALTKIKNDKQGAYALLNNPNADEDCLTNIYNKYVSGEKPNQEEQKMLNIYWHRLKNKLIYEADSGRKFIEVSSKEINPNAEETVEDYKLEHLITIDVTPNGYLSTIKDLVNKLIEKNIPFNITLRNPSELHYGFCDPIQLSVSTNRLNDTASIVDEVTKKNKENINKPNDILYFTENILFGYTPLFNGQGNVEALLHRVEEVINKYSPVMISDWSYRSMMLKKIKKDKNSYNQLVSEINRNILYKGINVGDIFNITRKEEPKKEVQEEPSLDEEKWAYTIYKPDTKRVVASRLPRIGKIAAASLGSVLAIYGILDHNEYALAAGAITVGGVLISSKDELMDLVYRHRRNRDLGERQRELLNSDYASLDEVQEDKTEERETIREEIANAFTPVEEEEKEVKEEKPIPKIDFSQSAFNHEPTVVPSNPDKEFNEYVKIDFDKHEDEVVDEEPTLSNTGSYKLPNEVVVTSTEEIIDEPGYAEGYDEYSLDSTEYEHLGILPRGTDSLTPIVVNDKGETTELIRYLKAQNIDSLIDKDVIIDGKKYSGIYYLSTLVVPSFKNNTKDNIYTLERLNDMYLEGVLDKVKESKGLFGWFKNKSIKK